MEIRNARAEEIEKIMEIYDGAREFMCKAGNPTQWSNYPPRELIEDDIKREKLYVCDDDGEIAGVFYFSVESDPTYEKIYEGNWLNDNDYAVMHRVAVAKQGRGVISFCFDYCMSRCRDLKIDTHEDNIPMQRALEKNGFKYCGIIYIDTGDARIAYQKSI